MTDSQVVKEQSATIPGHVDKISNIGLDADHRGINKFGSVNDENYLKVLAEVKKFVDDVPEALVRGNPQLPSLSMRLCLLPAYSGTHSSGVTISPKSRLHTPNARRYVFQFPGAMGCSFTDPSIQ